MTIAMPAAGRPAFRLRHALPLLAASVLAPAFAADACSARAPERSATVVELYTSEGCSSCPPADRWLSGLTDRPDVVALAFHVDYWDRLGWTDRFASAAYSERQRLVQAGSGARFVYTPQVLVNGTDWRSWPGPLPAGAASPVDLSLQREGGELLAHVAPRPGAALPARLAAYWALVEDSHVSAVKAGENAGATLRHDHVVRRYVPVAAWSSAQPQDLRWAVPAARGDHAQRALLVVTDAATGRPVQALSLGC